MKLFPAIDIRGGQCVRLRQGDYNQETVFDADPVAVAKRWVSQGARFLHLVDLDGAKAGRPLNRDVIAAIAQSCGVPCQVGGGLRDEASLRAILDSGVARAIVGTQALKDPDWFARMAQAFPERLVLGLDARDGMVATAGWLEVSTVPAVDFVRQFDALPIAAIVYTDIAKDGMMQGPNIEATAEVQAATRHLVIASGGIANADDVLRLAQRGIAGCILGRSLYEGTVHLHTLIEYLDSHGFREPAV